MSDVEASPYALNLRHLRALPTIVSEGSMSRAAERVGLSQPALTQGLAKLERQLGVALFDRVAGGMTATPAGQVLAERAAAAFALIAVSARKSGGGRGFAAPERLLTNAQMQALVRLADAGSFVGAAALTGLSQPALHRAVRDLEQICGLALVERRGRGIAFTAAGHRLARGLRLAAGEIAAGLADIVAQDKGEAIGRVAIGAMPLSRALVLPHAVAAFASAMPRVVVEIFEGSWRELVEPLQDGVIDMTIGALREEAPPGLEQRALFADQLAVIGRAGHPLTPEARPTLARMAQFDWIVGQAGTPLRAHWEALFAGAERPLASIECGSVMVIRGVLRESDKLTLLSRDQVALEIESGVLAMIGRPLPDAVRTIGLTTRVGWRPTNPQSLFIAMLEQAVRETRIPESE